MSNSQHVTRLTGPEISALWTQYVNDSMSICVLSYFQQTCNDSEIGAIFDHALSLSTSHVRDIKKKLQAEDYPVPIGFNENDVNLNAPPLFSEIFMISYLYAMTLHGLNAYSLSLGTSAREDQRNYYKECGKEAMELYDKIVDVMLKKGIYSRPPTIHRPDTVDFVKDQHYLSGWFHRRPLNGIEIGNLYYNNQKTIVKSVLEIGFSQVTKSKELREYFQRGEKICTKHIGIFNGFLEKDHLSSPATLISEVTNSTMAPFSDKLMLFHIVSLVSVTVGYYGAALSSCQRRDLMAQYLKIMAEIGLYAEDGANLLIKNGWMEQPPMASDRQALANNK
ncbi:DUF3231 family protein [Alkalihalobacterium bogoriense]|uniref:DUF3231 family protein n=1 Tax=Alkalihalobacterium bogoriense TaxID=246272 RepID=UPI000479F42B|nr:DUF3231 family protein [Alkalihalobacterium bogoriense]